MWFWLARVALYDCLGSTSFGCAGGDGIMEVKECVGKGNETDDDAISM